MSPRQLGALLATRPPPQEALPETPDEWNELVQAAVRERVAGALSSALADEACAPDAARHVLARELYRTSAFNVLLYRELARVLRANPTATPPVILKGGALATTVYDDIAHRPMSDLDLLVQREDLSTWRDRLLELGYELVSPEMADGLGETIHYQIALRGGEHREVVIELHWSLVAGDGDWRAPDVDWFWQQTRPWPGLEDLSCPAALQLTPLASILYLSAHAMLQHGDARSRLIWLLDIHRVIERTGEDLDWDAVVEHACECRWDAAVARALERSVEYFGTPVPQSAIAALSNASATSPAQPTRAHVLDKANVEASRAELVLRELGCLNASSKRRLVRAILLPTPQYVKWRYPRAGSLWPLAYIYRWGVVAYEGLAHAGRVLTRALSFVFL